jgi:hypothetical protein
MAHLTNAFGDDVRERHETAATAEVDDGHLRDVWAGDWVSERFTDSGGRMHR